MNAQTLKYAYRIALLIVALAAAYLIYTKGIRDGRAAERAARPDTVRTIDTLRLPAPPPKILPGRPVPFPVRDQQALDSLEAVYRDSLDALRRRLAQPFSATYEDSVRTSRMTAHPTTLAINDSTVYKPIIRPATTLVDTVESDPTLWEMKEELAITAVLFYLLGRTVR